LRNLKTIDDDDDDEVDDLIGGIRTPVTSQSVNQPAHQFSTSISTGTKHNGTCYVY